MEYLSKKEASEYLKISKGTVERWMKYHGLPYIKVKHSRRVLFVRSDIDTFMESQKRVVSTKDAKRQPKTCLSKKT
jgi:excisionase family DNA binding protein